MDLSKLLEYADTHYRIKEVCKWPEAPNFSVLADPETEKFAAVLMRVWDEETGEMAELADFRCDGRSLRGMAGIEKPWRMRGNNWTGIRFDAIEDDEFVFRLFDEAIELCRRNANTIVLSPLQSEKKKVYQDTPIPMGRSVPQGRDNVPERILKMMSLYEFKDGSFQERCRNFYRQGKYMEDYEDSFPMNNATERYFVTYHDLRPEQLRGYFTWRTNVRKGRYDASCRAFSYLYVYELLNLIGVKDAMESLKKLEEYDAACAMQRNSEIHPYLLTWMPALAIMHGLDPAIARFYMDSYLLWTDRALAVLRQPEDCDDKKLVEALAVFDRRTVSSSLVIQKYPEEGTHLYAELYRRLCRTLRQEGRDFFTECFGEITERPWRPMANAVYWQKEKHEDTEYVLNESRSYVCVSGNWKERCWPEEKFQTWKLLGLLHEAERRFRSYFKIRRTLKAREAEAWAIPYIEAVLNEEKERKRELAKPKITIRLGELDAIRRDSLKTRDSLLTEEEKEELEALNRPEPALPEVPEDDGLLDALQKEVLAKILQGLSVKELLRSENEMAELFAESLNEALFDEIGDIAVECMDGEIYPVEDYRGDLLRILGGDGG